MLWGKDTLDLSEGIRNLEIKAILTVLVPSLVHVVDVLYASVKVGQKMW